MACCFGRTRVRRRRRLSTTRSASSSSEHDVFLYPASSGNGEVLLQYGGTLRPELVYGNHLNALGLETSSLANATSATGTNTIARKTLDQVAPPLHYNHKSLEASKLASDECSVCLEAFDVKSSIVRTLPRCGHVFHSHCISTWLENSQVCPGKFSLYSRTLDIFIPIRVN